MVTKNKNGVIHATGKDADNIIKLLKGKSPSIIIEFADLSGQYMLAFLEVETDVFTFKLFPSMAHFHTNGIEFLTRKLSECEGIQEVITDKMNWEKVLPGFSALVSPYKYVQNTRFVARRIEGHIMKAFKQFPMMFQDTQ